MVSFDWTLKINISHGSESLRNLQRGNVVRFSLLTQPHTSIKKEEGTGVCVCFASIVAYKTVENHAQVAL